MSIFSNVKQKFISTMERRGRVAAHRELMAMSDRRLEDFGIAPYLLRQGISAWPWKAETDNDSAIRLGRAAYETVVSQSEMSRRVTQIAPALREKRVINRAINELNDYSDRELAELGVSRKGIEQAVRFGRPAIEGTSPQHDRAA